MNTRAANTGRVWRSVLGAWLVLAGIAGSTDLEAAASREYELKAVFLLNFTLFTQWPPAAFASPEVPVVIGVLGADPFGALLEDAVSGEKAGGRTIVVRRFDRVDEARECHVLFISASERRGLGRIMAALRARPILTVSDLPDFARRGGMIGFYFDGPRLRFEINLPEVQRNALQLSSQLLQVARIVPEPAE